MDTAYAGGRPVLQATRKRQSDTLCSRSPNETGRVRWARSGYRRWSFGIVYLILDLIDPSWICSDARSVDIFAAQIKALLERPDAEPLLANIKCPVMVLCGRQDTWSPVDIHEQMTARIAAEPPCGH